MNKAATILCVDDEQLALTVRKMVLEHEGYRVLAATDMDQAMMLCLSNPVDLVLTDYYLQGATTGTDLAKRIKKKKPRLKVAILSGSAEIPENMQNVDAFLSKTLSPPEMLAEVARLLDEGKGASRAA